MADTQVESTSSYQYDSLGRRVGKQSEIKGQSDQKRFLWQGLRMLREESPEQSSLYLYEPGSYAPLARVDQKEGETENKVYYYHTDQIGTPLEMTDAEGQIVWQAKYRAWGAVEKLVVNEVEQNLRFQGQYFDVETGLHYNTFRYYDPEIGRFTTQDPIGLLGGENLYQYAPNTQSWIDALGLACDKWTVNSHKANKSAVKGKNLDFHSHHVGQKNLMKDLVEGYDPATAPAMLVPRVGHTVSKEGVGIVSRSRINPNTGLPFTSARDVVARDIKELRRVYPDIPNTKLQELIKLNKSMYPEMR
ncbi:RHS family protein [Pseudomonas syringae group genomosp. 3]|uniref:RHS family protein n=2 Tax=Pseudomonas syringae group genomosp. 3 TaxID=251701 RepID=A0ABD6V5F3_9PSED|nr:RHS family protein [Pseudomonas syringae group genomosp. 3]